MKKLVVLLSVVTLMFCMNTAVFADNVVSPISTPSTSDGEDNDKAPQTGEGHLLISLGIGAAACAVGAVVAGKSLKKN